MVFSRAFFRGVAVCSALSAVTTLLLIFLPRAYGPVSGFDERVALHANPYYMARIAVGFVHPFLVMTAAWGVVARVFRRSAGSVTTGFLFFVLWGFAEAAQQALLLVALNWTSRAAYATADEAERVLLRANMAGIEGIWDALFFLLLVAFLIANVLYGVATRRGARLERTISWLYFAAAGLTVLSLVGGYGGPAVADTLMAWLYPTLQPAARLLVGVWLWRATEPESPGDALAGQGTKAL